MPLGDDQSLDAAATAKLSFRRPRGLTALTPNRMSSGRLAAVVLFAAIFPVSAAHPQSDDAPGRLLGQAVSGGDLVAMRALFDSGQATAATIIDGEQNTALHIAAERCNLSAVSYLLSKGGDPNQLNKWGDSPLHIANVRCGAGTSTATALASGASIGGGGSGSTPVSPPPRRQQGPCVAEGQIGDVIHGQGASEPTFLIPIIIDPVCEGPCQGLIRYTYTFAIRDGGSGSGSGLKPWSSRDEERVIVPTRNWSTSCPSGLSACYLTDYEVTSVSCHG